MKNGFEELNCDNLQKINGGGAATVLACVFAAVSAYGVIREMVRDAGRRAGMEANTYGGGGRRH